MSVNIAAVDLGASSGRVIWASYDPANENITMQEMHRFTAVQHAFRAMAIGANRTFAI